MPQNKKYFLDYDEFLNIYEPKGARLSNLSKAQSNSVKSSFAHKITDHSLSKLIDDYEYEQEKMQHEKNNF